MQKLSPLALGVPEGEGYIEEPWDGKETLLEMGWRGVTRFSEQ